MAAGNSVERLVEGYGRAVEHASDDDRKRVGLVARLMTHYWQPEMSAHERKCQALDWRSDLAEFPVSVVDAACAEYRRSETKERPTPSVIRSLCIGIVMKRRALPPPEDRITNAGVPAWLDDVWRDGGMQARNAAIAKSEAAYARAEAWRMQKWKESPEPLSNGDRAYPDQQDEYLG